jgi:hypothetical protein
MEQLPATAGISIRTMIAGRNTGSGREIWWQLIHKYTDTKTADCMFQSYCSRKMQSAVFVFRF